LVTTAGRSLPYRIINSSPEPTVSLRLDEPLGEIPVYLPEGVEIPVADGAT
jgi:hypothetical protein